MRKLGITLLVLAVLLVAAGLIAPHLIDINRYRGQIQAQVQNRLSRPVSLGEMRLSLFPPSLQVHNLAIAEDPRFTAGQPFLSAERLTVAVKLWPLLRKQIEVKSLKLERPHIELIRDAQGKWNFASLGEAPSGAPPAPAANQPPPLQESKQPQHVSVGSLIIQDGQVALTDQQKQLPRAVYDHIDFNLSDFAPDRQFSMKATAHLPGKGKQAISLQGRALVQRGPCAYVLVWSQTDWNQPGSS